jgi:hypothetical protein
MKDEGKAVEAFTSSFILHPFLFSGSSLRG